MRYKFCMPFNDLLMLVFYRIHFHGIILEVDPKNWVWNNHSSSILKCPSVFLKPFPPHTWNWPEWFCCYCCWQEVHVWSHHCRIFWCIVKLRTLELSNICGNQKNFKRDPFWKVMYTNCDLLFKLTPAKHNIVYLAWSPPLRKFLICKNTMLCALWSY